MLKVLFFLMVLGAGSATCAIAENINKANYYNIRASEFSGRGDYKKAIENYTQAIKYAPNSEVLFINRGACYINIGLVDKAIKDFSAAIKISPSTSIAWNNRGLAYLKISNRKKARQDFKEACEILKDRDACENLKDLSEETQNDDFFFEKAEKYRTEKKYYEAIKYYQKAIQKYKENLMAYFGIADAYLNAFGIDDKVDKAHRYIDEAIRISPQSAYVYLEKAKIYAEEGKYDLASKMYTKSLSISPEISTTYYNRAVCYKNINEKYVSDNTYNWAPYQGDMKKSCTLGCKEACDKLDDFTNSGYLMGGLDPILPYQIVGD